MARRSRGRIRVGQSHARIGPWPCQRRRDTGVGTIKISLSGQHGVVYLRVAYITGPLLWAEVDSANPGAPVPAPLWESLVWAVADRADQAQPARTRVRSCRMTDIHWSDRYAVNGMFIREILPRDRNEVIDECMRDRLIGRIPVGALMCQQRAVMR